MVQTEINRNLMIVGILAFVLVFVEVRRLIFFEFIEVCFYFLQGFCIVAALGLLCYLRQRDRYI